MNVISLTNSKFSKLNLMDLDKNIWNTEGKIYNYHYRGEDKVLKELYDKDGSRLANKLYTLERLDEYRQLFPRSFYLPDNLVVVGGKIIGFTLPKNDGVNLNVLLNDNKVDAMMQIYYLKKVGEILHQLDYIRKNPEVRKFYINDLHESNFMVNPINGEVSVIDLDSCRIGNDTFFASKFLNPKALLNNVSGKYKIIGDDKTNYTRAYVEADRNTDLYCYTMMILQYFSKYNKINGSNLDEFYEYLNYLESIGINHNLMECFSALVSNKENMNPGDYLRDIAYDQIGKANMKVFKLKK